MRGGAEPELWKIFCLLSLEWYYINYHQSSNWDFHFLLKSFNPGFCLQIYFYLFYDSRSQELIPNHNCFRGNFRDCPPLCRLLRAFEPWKNLAPIQTSRDLSSNRKSFLLLQPPPIRYCIELESYSLLSVEECFFWKVRKSDCWVRLWEKASDGIDWKLVQSNSFFAFPERKYHPSGYEPIIEND